MKIDYTALGKRIAKRRKELGLKQYEVIMSLCSVLNTTPDYFLLGTASAELYDNDIASKITPMTDEHKRLISGMIQLITEIENN